VDEAGVVGREDTIGAGEPLVEVTASFHPHFERADGVDAGRQQSAT
jgi:hypothetical protein